MTERRSISGGNIPTNQVITDLKGIRLIFGSPSSVNNHGSDVNNLTLAPGQFQLTQINRNSNKLQAFSISNATASAGQTIIRTIAPTKISSLTRNTGLTAATILQQQAVGQQPAGGQQPTQAKIIAHQQQPSSSSSPPQKIFIQAVSMNASAIQKVVQKPQVQKSLFAISSGSTSNIIINNNNGSANNSTSNSGTQLYRVIGTQQGQIRTAGPLVKHTQAGLANKSKSLSIVNPTQVTKLTQQPITSQRLILPATNQVQVAIAASPAMFQSISAPTSVSYIATPGNQTHQGFAFVQTPTVITPSNQHSALSDSSGASSENSSNLRLQSHASNENLNRGSSRQQNQQQQQQQQQQPLQWLNEPIPTVRQRKPCNCTKSQCLKLYCECFANGEFCKDCNCCNCANNLEHEEERTRAIKSCMERNPHAFHPKIGKGGSNRHHNKGCNCKRSGCLKNYCECYEAKILCSNLCRCIGCRNYEESVDRQKLMQLADAAEVRVQQQTAAESKLSLQILGTPVKPQAISSNGQRPPYTFVTLDVIEAIGSCLIAEADDSQLSDVLQERQILEEFGRCLSQVIEMASKTRASSP